MPAVWVLRNSNKTWKGGRLSAGKLYPAAFIDKCQQYWLFYALHLLSAWFLGYQLQGLGTLEGDITSGPRISRRKKKSGNIRITHLPWKGIRQSMLQTNTFADSILPPKKNSAAPEQAALFVFCFRHEIISIFLLPG